MTIENITLDALTDNLVVEMNNNWSNSDNISYKEYAAQNSLNYSYLANSKIDTLNFTIEDFAESNAYITIPEYHPLGWIEANTVGEDVVVSFLGKELRIEDTDLMEVFDNTMVDIGNNQNTADDVSFWGYIMFGA